MGKFKKKYIRVLLDGSFSLSNLVNAKVLHALFNDILAIAEVN